MDILKNINMWRIRLGETSSLGEMSVREIFEIARQESPPCVPVGWGKVDLSQENIEDVARDYEGAYDEPFDGSNMSQIESFLAIKPNDIVFVMTVKMKLCAIGIVLGKRHVEDENFDIEIIGGTGYSKRGPYGTVSFYNRLDVKWIVNLDVSIPIRSLTNSSELIGTLSHQYTVLPIKETSIVEALKLICECLKLS